MPIPLSKIARDVVGLPRVEVSMWGDDACADRFKTFTARHPRLPLVQKHRWGIGLLTVPQTYDEYFSDPRRHELRTKTRRAEKRGYRFARFAARTRLDEMLEINASAPTRGGRPMDGHYLDARWFASSLDRTPEFSGVFNADGKLVAYAEVMICGELFSIPRLLGHADHLKNGVMDLMIGGIVREMVERRNASGQPRWGEYGSIVGADPGLRYFKERLGFEPHNVRWVWRSSGLDA